MALANFVARITTITAVWLNKVDAFVVNIFDEATTKDAARAALTLDGPMSLTQGGTGAVSAEAARTVLDLKSATELASSINGLGAALIGIEDSGSNFVATTVEGALAEIGIRRLGTIAELRDVIITFVADGSQCTVLGHTTPGDGGDGTFYWNASSADADDNGITILPTGHVGNGRWKRANSDIVNVKDFGASGGGVDDDTTPLTSAILAADTILLPAGTYIFSNTTFTKNVRIVGAGKRATTIKWKASSAETSLFKFSTASVIHVVFENLTIDGNNANQTDSTGYYASVQFDSGGGSSLKLDNVRFTNGRIQDVRVDNDASTPVYFDMTDCEFDNGLEGSSTRVAGYVQAQDNVICTWENNRSSMPDSPTYGRFGLTLQRSGTSTYFGRVIAHGNTFENIGRGLASTDTIGCIDVYSGGDLISIFGNTSKGSVGRFINIKSDCGDCVISANTCIDHYDDVPAIVLYDQQSTYTAISIGRNLIVSNNIIRNTVDASGKGIFIFGNDTNSVSDFANVIVEGNIIDDITGYAIYAQQVTNLNVIGNVIANSARGFHGTSISGYCKVKNNTITDCSDSGIVFTGSNAACDAIIQGNMLENAESTAIGLFSAVNSFVINGNVCRGTATFLNTSGATNRSSIVGNDVDGETTVWTKSGSYGTVVYDKNITSIAVAFATRELTIATGAITAIADWHFVDTETDAATDDLDTINGGYEGRILVIQASDSTRDVVAKDGSGNLVLAGDFTMNNNEDSLTLMYRGTKWYELSRSDNGA